MNILVLGAYGLLGSHLCRSLLEESYKVFRQGSSVNAELSCLPYLDDELLKIVKQKKPEVIINLIALTNVDDCEKDPKLAYLLNVKTVEKIIEDSCKQLGLYTYGNVFNQSKRLLNNLNQRDRDIVQEQLNLNEDADTIS